MRENDVIIAGQITLEAGVPRLVTGHPDHPTCYQIALDETGDYSIQVLAETLDEARREYDGFDLCYRYCQGVLSDLPDTPTARYVLTTGALWVLQSKVINPEWLRSPDRTPIHVQESLPALVEKASALHLEFVGLVARTLPSQVLN
jgi:LmbE family N-acetylglucosaminyl deacetylase